ncbi:hypothetical protein Nepgr_020314 [Nepenthes gracilis]|uniref:Uncharacterized protein n=1 Tax=Nepenthes gracilis TaxID=150966 RepID=A0AAD3SVU4_NEPGR|nr:hypothetical protein Nepgr_020314 [Nepenthes gracilis]
MPWGSKEHDPSTHRASLDKECIPGSKEAAIETPPFSNKQIRIYPMKKQECRKDIFGTTSKLHIPPTAKLSWNFCSNSNTGRNTRLNQKPNAPYIVIIYTTADAPMHHTCT